METADVVIVGGGVLGGSVAFYLAKQHAGRIILLERDFVAQGNSSLAAGLLTRGRFKPYLISMVLETYEAIAEIEKINRDSLNVQRTGCMYAAISPEHQKGIRELTSVSSQCGLKVEWLDSTAASHLVPWLRLPRDTSIIFMPEDGYIDGYTLANGYIRAARSLGVEVREQTEVLSLLQEGERTTGVRTEHGDISASLVIDAAGVWAGMLAHAIGIGLPMAPIRSHYWITGSHALFSPAQPFVILPDARAYARPEGDRLLFGFREKQSVSVNPRQLPDKMDGFTFQQDPNGWTSLLEGMPELGLYFPLIEKLEISSYIRGLSNYTPDGNFVIGMFPGLQGFFAATGCAGAGIAMSGGIGRLVSELVMGRPTFTDPAPHRMDRFGLIDPTDASFIQTCADARSGKVTG